MILTLLPSIRIGSLHLKNGRVVKDGPTNEIINSDSLKEIYDMDIPIKQLSNCRICVYFQLLKKKDGL